MSENLVTLLSFRLPNLSNFQIDQWTLYKCLDGGLNAGQECLGSGKLVFDLLGGGLVRGARSKLGAGVRHVPL